MKKRILAILALVVLCCCLLVACKPNEEDNGNYYTVTFDSQGGSAVASQRVLAGNPARAPESPTRNDDIFQGWYKSADENAAMWNFSTDRVDGDITLYAFWRADLSEPTESITYELNSDGTGYVVTGAGQDSKIVIPEVYQGLPVVEIGERAFAYSRHTSDILSVTIPDSVTAIGLNAFHNQDALVSVNIGTNSKLVSIGNNAFSGNSALEAIYLPRGFTTLGDSVFNNCGSLNTITVASDNAVFSSEGNNLIEIATHALIRGSNNSVIPSSVTEIAPAAFRRANGIHTLNIPLSVTKIGNYFIADSTITTIRYEGTEEQWNAIEKSSSMWNFGNKDVVVQFNAATLKILIAYFSRTGENYSVGFIDKGNTNIIAEMIAEETGGELFEIQRKTPYSNNYEEVKDEAQREKNDNARPELLEYKNVSEYDIIFIGYPIWHGDMPMPLYTFIEDNDWAGKTVFPFCTHEGSGLSGTMSTIRTKCAGATVLEGLAVRGATAQNQQSQARQSVINWLNGLNY